VHARAHARACFLCARDQLSPPLSLSLSLSCSLSLVALLSRAHIHTLAFALAHRSSLGTDEVMAVGVRELLAKRNLHQ